MTRRERLEAKAAKRLDWAQSRRNKAAAAFNKAESIASQIPLGQPILVGHHSEKHARRDQERIHNGMRQGIDHSDMAKHHESKADGLERQLETSIYSDDPDAIENLEAKAVALEAQRDTMKAANKAYKKGGWEAVRAIMGDAATDSAIRSMSFSWCKAAPFPPYALTNIGATIRTARKRIGEIKRRQAVTAQAEAAGGCIVKKSTDGEYCSVTFAEKPERSIINDLKAAGFHWSGGSWNGHSAKLPESLKEFDF